MPKVLDRQFPCYILNLVSGEVIHFHMIPDDVSDSMSANYDQQTIRGRSLPIKSYNDSGPRSISFTATLHSSYNQDNSITFTVNKLRALVYPDYEGKRIYPPLCLIRIGDLIVKSVVTSVNVTWKKPYRNQTYMFAEVAINAEEVMDNVMDMSEVEKGQYYTRLGLSGPFGNRW